MSTFKAPIAGPGPSTSSSMNPNFHRLDSTHPLAPVRDIDAVGDDVTSYPNPNVQGNPYIYLAVYSSVPVYEMMIRGIGVMRRRVDSYLNATQILKVAGVDKNKRTRIIEKEIILGVHEKVQGGYGRYQGTWIPFDRAVELANQFGVAQLLAPLLDYTAPPAGTPLAINASHHAGEISGSVLDNDVDIGSGEAESSGVHGNHVNGKKRASTGNAAAEYDDVKRSRGGEQGGALGSQSIYHHPLTKLRLKTATRAKVALAPLDPLQLERHKTILKSVFSLAPPSPALTPTAAASAPASPAINLTASFPADLDPNTSIDDHEHTALHWAAALARTSLVAALIESAKADVHRGNNVGETALIRAVLVTNNSDNDQFPQLLALLAPSLRTVDDVGRSVLHHAALVAGVKGRASSARYYMECVLEYIARFEQGAFQPLVDAQDMNGDTALCIAARVGNKGLVRLLVEVGADRAKPNKLGLRAGDFGLQDVGLELSPAEQVLSTISVTPSISVPAQKSIDILSTITGMLTSLSSSFDTELSTQTEALNHAQEQVRQAARELVLQRDELEKWHERVKGVEHVSQRIANLEKALEVEDSFDWTGRTEVDGSPAVISATGGGVGEMFRNRGPESTLNHLPAGMAIELDIDPPLVTPTTISTSGEETPDVVRLVRLEMWYARVVSLLKDRVAQLQGGDVEQELKLRRIVAQSCGVEEDKVEEMLEFLIAALESDGTGVDLARIARFLSRAKDGSYA